MPFAQSVLCARTFVLCCAGCGGVADRNFTDVLCAYVPCCHVCLVVLLWVSGCGVSVGATLLHRVVWQRSSENNVVDSSEILPELPLDLRREVLLVSLGHVVRVIDFFRVRGDLL